jgi:hypothetical protein
LAAGFSILPLELDQSLGVGKDPLFRTTAPGHPGLLQIRAGGTIQKQRPSLANIVKLFFRQHSITSNQSDGLYYMPNREIMQQ